MAVKSYQLMKLEELGVLYQDKKTGAWYGGSIMDPDKMTEKYEDLTPYLYQAGMFEH